MVKNKKAGTRFLAIFMVLTLILAFTPWCILIPAIITGIWYVQKILTKYRHNETRKNSIGEDN
jgi:hypothetical protein